LPLFLKKELFEWLKVGKKTIGVRKIDQRDWEVDVFFELGRKECDRTTALTLEDVLAYLRELYDGYDSIFTAYSVEPLNR
jgi:hypothetical protein